MALDIIAFGALLLATFLEGSSALAGTPLLVAGGGLCYLCTRELVALLFPNRLESTESFATSYALLVVGFVYFFLRNDSDFILLVITLALMMGSLMLAIALIGCLSERRWTTFLQLMGVTAATTVVAGLFAHLVILPTVVPHRGIIAAMALASWVWWRIEKARPTRDVADTESVLAPRSRSVVIFAFVSTFLIGLVGAALAGGSLKEGNTLIKSGSVGWLVALPGLQSVLVWEAVRPALARDEEEGPCVIPFLRGRLIDRMVPLICISTVLFYYFWFPRG